MRMNQRKPVRALAIALLVALSFTIGRLHADNGTCNGSSAAVPFTDVESSQFFCQIAEAYFTGLTNGTTATTYSPHDPVPREQMAAFVTRTLDQSLARRSRRAALGKWWTQQFCPSTALTPVGNHPVAVKADGEFLWVANSVSGTVTRVRASDGKAIATWTGMSHPNDLLIADGRVYVIGATTPGKLYVINPDQPAGNATLLANIGNIPISMAFDGEHILTANNAGSVTNYHVPSGSQITYTNGLSAPAGIVYDGHFFWVTDPGDEKIKEMSVSGQIYQAIPLANDPFFPVFDGANIWVPCYNANSVAVVRASTGTVIATLTGSGLNQPYATAFDGEHILVTNFAGDSVSMWNGSSLTPIGTFSTGAGSGPQGVCSDGLNFWLTLSGTNKLARY